MEIAVIRNVKSNVPNTNTDWLRPSLFVQEVQASESSSDYLYHLISVTKFLYLFFSVNRERLCWLHKSPTNSPLNNWHLSADGKGCVLTVFAVSFPFFSPAICGCFDFLCVLNCGLLLGIFCGDFSVVWIFQIGAVSYFVFSFFPGNCWGNIFSVRLFVMTFQLLYW